MLATRALLSAIALGSQLLLSDAFATAGGSALLRPCFAMVSGVRQAQSPREVGVRRSGRLQGLAMKAADSGDARATALRQLESFQREDYHCPWWANNGNVNSIA